MPYSSKELQREAQAKHYRENSGKYKESSRNARIRRYQRVAELKSGPCVDCGNKYPHYVMQFDHVNDDKVNSVSNMVTRSSWSKILEEIAKCELVCANCHAERTWKRKKELSAV